jgi:UDP-N-acetylmuramoylalanine--D-glutamate ligase
LRACRNIYWIVGGRAKQGGLEGLENSLAEVRHAYLIGEAATPFANQLATIAPTLPSQTYDKLDIAVAAAADQALSDDLDEATILLSPAAASFDQFANFEARGDAFCASVTAWKQRQEGGM